MLKTHWLSALIAILLLSAAAVGLYAALRHHTPQAKQNIKTYTAAYNHPIRFTGHQAAETKHSFYYDPKMGMIHDWYVDSGKTVKKDQPLFEYYNKENEQHLTLLRKQLNYLDQHSKRSNFLNLHTDLEKQFYAVQAGLRVKQFTALEGVVHIIDKHPSKPQQLFAEVYSPKRIIKAYVSESVLHQLKLKLNQEAEIKGQTAALFKGKIQKIDAFPIAQSEDSKSSQYEVQISTNARLPIGSRFNISISTHFIALPKDVLYGKNAVIIKKNQQMVKRIIKYSENSGMVIISEGLLPGEKVVAQPKNFTSN
ncbi:hypothetical protein MUA90_12010 [Staphylococcus sp. IVB6181]|uniref:hypothetical protein n=1 Tax=Staphylococcus sp. IVB6181 TaxID=2929481 RepID=UPI0021D34A71|nr:hypothetical protein [Staphylococcus sp. IVB6181]UXV34722.1 hypothetical protein MUA90_12010 [Staphylococcus sp. IVB6181]